MQVTSQTSHPGLPRAIELYWRLQVWSFRTALNAGGTDDSDFFARPDLVSPDAGWPLWPALHVV